MKIFLKYFQGVLRRRDQAVSLEAYQFSDSVGGGWSGDSDVGRNDDDGSSVSSNSNNDNGGRNSSNLANNTTDINSNNKKNNKNRSLTEFEILQSTYHKITLFTMQNIIESTNLLIHTPIPTPSPNTTTNGIFPPTGGSPLEISSSSLSMKRRKYKNVLNSRNEQIKIRRVLVYALLHMCASDLPTGLPTLLGKYYKYVIYGYCYLKNVVE